MDQKNLIIAIALSVAILVGFQFLMPRPHPVVTTEAPIATGTTTAANPAGAPVSGTPQAQPGSAGAQTAAAPREVPRLAIDAPAVRGSISLLGARIDDLLLRDYHDDIDPASPLVRLLEPRADPEPYFVQFGWTPAAGATAGGAPIAIPTDDTVWTGTGPLSVNHPVTLSWDNGQGQVFEIALSIDEHYMFTVEQRVRNTGAAPISVYPWSRIRRDYTRSPPATTSCTKACSACSAAR